MSLSEIIDSTKLPIIPEIRIITPIRPALVASTVPPVIELIRGSIIVKNVLNTPRRQKNMAILRRKSLLLNAVFMPSLKFTRMASSSAQGGVGGFSFANTRNKAAATAPTIPYIIRTSFIEKPFPISRGVIKSPAAIPK